MSISTISHSNPLELRKVQGRDINAAFQARANSSAFAILDSSKRVEQVDAIRSQGSNPLNVVTPDSSLTELSTRQQFPLQGGFSDAFVKAQADMGLSATNNAVAPNTQQVKPNEHSFGIADLYLFSSLQSYRTGGVEETNRLEGDPSVNNNYAANQYQDVHDGSRMVNLEQEVLDFSALLPVGMRDFIDNLDCTEVERNNIINVMIFGDANGPHGKKASDYFGQSEMSAAKLAERVQELVDSAKINTSNISGEDYEFVLRNPNSALGQSLAVEQGASLEDRALERELESTFRRDMALMQILARANNQSASIF